VIRGREIFRTIGIVALNVAIFYFLIRWCLENIRGDELMRQVTQVPLGAMVAAVAVNLLAICFYGLRLAVLTGQRFSVSLAVVILGFGLNAVLPFRFGELARLYYGQRLYSIPAPRLLAVAFVEKLCDVAALALLACVTLTLANVPFIHKGVAITLIAVVAVGFVAAFTYRKLVTRIGILMSRNDHLHAFHLALHEQSHLHHLKAISACTLAIWLLNILVVYVAFAGSLPSAGVGIADAIALLLVSALAISIPTAPASIGVFEAGIVVYLTRALLVDNESALAIAVVFHLAVILPQLVIMLGIIGGHEYVRRRGGDGGSNGGPRSDVPGGGQREP
jgi:hypothetical protein